MHVLMTVLLLDDFHYYMGILSGNYLCVGFQDPDVDILGTISVDKMLLQVTTSASQGMSSLSHP